MSRHRDIRNLDADDFDDEMDSYGSSYGSSYMDETTLSKSMERYVYNRGVPGGTPKMGHFVLGRSDSVPSVPEEDSEDVDGAGARIRPRSDSETSSGSNTFDDLEPESQIKLSKCLEDVLDIVGDTIPEHTVKEAIVRCDFDTEVAVNTLLNNPIGHKGGTKQPVDRKRLVVADDDGFSPNSAKSQAMSIRPPTFVPDSVQSNIETVKFKGSGSKPPAPMDYNAIPTIKTSDSLLETPKVQQIKKEDRSRSQSPQPGASNVNTSSSVSTPSSALRVAMRKGTVDALDSYQKERGNRKDLLNMVVVGHVDSGKSTLMGHVLFRLGSVTSKAMHKYEQESKKIGKQSFAFAWVLDETSEERERGITMDVGHNTFETNSKCVTLLDAPGHKDFIPNMISGAYQADVAILVVNATRGEFEAGFDAGGQTREHALLVRSLGVSQLAVAVNKMDTVDYSQERFEEVSKKLSAFLRQVGFKESDVQFVPCSGFTGDNLVEKSSNITSWYSGPTLLTVIDQFRPPERLVTKPFRLSISDIFKPQSSGFCVAGRIESGLVQKEDKILITPLNELATVKSVLSQDDMAPMNQAFAGDHVSLVLIGPDINSVANGMVACDPIDPIPVTKKIRARIVVFNIDLPLTKGFPVVFHYGCVQVQAMIKKLVAQVNKSSGEIIKKHPRCLTKNCNAIVDIVTEAPICIELYANVKELGRFMLRSGGKTIAAGLVTEIL